MVEVAPPGLGESIAVRPLVEFEFVDEPFSARGIEIGVQSAVIDVFVVVRLQLVLDRQSFGVLVTSDDDQQVALERRESANLAVE